MALLFAKCSDTVQIYGYSRHVLFSKDANKKMKQIAVPPVAKRARGQIEVVFYSWSALPIGEINKWSFLFRGNAIVKLKRKPVSAAE